MGVIDKAGTPEAKSSQPPPLGGVFGQLSHLGYDGIPYCLYYSLLRPHPVTHKYFHLAL